jgi:hypothetical protein
VAFYSSPPIQSLVISRFEIIPVDADPSQPGTCSPPFGSAFPAMVGVATPFNLSDLQLSPPFHAE